MSNSIEDDETANPPYQVGNKHPPKETQFKKGKSGNSKGRPKGSANLRTRVRHELRQTVSVTRNGRTTKMTKAALIANRLVDTAARGDFKAAQFTMRIDDDVSIPRQSRGL